MRIYLARTGLGDATYIPEKLRGIDLICPRMYRSGASRTLNCVFLPDAAYPGYGKRKEILKALNQRIQNPEDNTEFSAYGGGWARSIRTKPMPVKEKLLSGSETVKLESLVGRITSRKEGLRKAVYFSGFVFGDEDNFKNLPSIEAELKLQLKAVGCLRDYQTFFRKVYESADWVGNSEEALAENA